MERNIFSLRYEYIHMDTLTPHECVGHYKAESEDHMELRHSPFFSISLYVGAGWVDFLSELALFRSSFFHNHEHTHTRTDTHKHKPLPFTNPVSHREGEHSTHFVRRGYRVMQLTLTGLQHIINRSLYPFASNIQAVRTYWRNTYSAVFLGWISLLWV